MLNSPLKSGLVSMSVPEDQMIAYHVERCFENGLISLRLPELGIETVFVTTNPSI